jgi:hypothetical protein
VTDPAPSRPRGWVSIYLVAFAMLLGAGLVLAIAARGFLASIGLLWLSIALSAGALVLAVVSAVLPPRRRSR